jgi:hypothetical protein
MLMLWTPELMHQSTGPERRFMADMWAAVLESSIGGQPAYRLDLPAHNQAHIFEETLPVGLSLAQCDGGDNNSPRNRRIIIGILESHDMWSYVPLDPQEGFKTAEERTAVWARPLIREFFDEDDALEVGSGIGATSPTGACETSNERKARRADISNLGSESIRPVLAKTVNVFYEEVLLSIGRGQRVPTWTPFLDRQVPILSQLLETDLSVKGEAIKNGKGTFNRTAERYVNMFASKQAIRDPKRFKARYVHHLAQLVPDLGKIRPYITNRAAA